MDKGFTGTTDKYDRDENYYKKQKVDGWKKLFQLSCLLLLPQGLG
jgi:hypothetical protein